MWYCKKDKSSKTTAFSHKATTKALIGNLEKLTNQDLLLKLNNDIIKMPIENILSFLTSQELNKKILSSSSEFSIAFLLLQNYCLHKKISN